MQRREIRSARFFANRSEHHARLFSTDGSMKLLCRSTLLFILAASAVWAAPAFALSEAEMDYNTAVGLVQKKHYRKALPFFDHAIKLAPSIGKIYLGRGDALLVLEEPERALVDFNTALKLDPSLAKGYEQRARCQFELGKFKAAVDDISSAIGPEQDQHNKANMLKDRATFYLRLGQSDKAIQDLTTAISIRPKEYYNYSHRGDVYASLHQYRKAVEDYTYAIKINDGRFDDFDSLYTLRARAYEKLGRKDLAALDRKKAATYSGDIRPF
jgi:tetratricopeptide (TPR) repeat protein